MLIVVDVDGLEERLVHQSAFGIWCGCVSRVAVVSEVECPSEVRGHERLVVVAAGEAIIDSGEALLDPRLLVFEEFEGDDVGVARLEEFGALLHQTGPFLGEARLFGLGFAVVLDQVAFELTLDRFAPLRLELDSGVVLSDELFHGVDRNRLEGAVRALLMASDTDEVGIDPS